MITGKTIILTLTFVSKVMSLLFNMLSRLVITILPSSRCLFISWLQSQCAVILESLKNKVCTVLNCFSVYLPWSNGTGCHDHCFLNVEFKPTSSLSSFIFINRLFSFSSLSAIRVLSFALTPPGYWYFSQQSWFQLGLHPAQRFSLCSRHIN